MQQELNRDLDHDDPVVCIDHVEHGGLHVTVDTEGLIKVWSEKRDLLSEIKFNEPVNSVCFMNANYDLLVAHGGKLS